MADHRALLEYPTQEFLHDPNSGTVGDCWRACIAGILSLPLEDVPHFAREYSESGEPEPEWWVKTVEFVEDFTDGYTIGCYSPTFPAYTDPRVASVWPLVIADGKSPRGDYLHAVLADANTGEMVWDPHPSRDGLNGGIETMFVVVDR